jgi:hypothetical protein
MINRNEIPTLNETTFQEFLLNNQKQMFVYETEDYDYHYYLPSHCMISKSSKAEAKFMRQA